MFLHISLQRPSFLFVAFILALIWPVLALSQAASPATGNLALPGNLSLPEGLFDQIKQALPGLFNQAQVFIQRAYSAGKKLVYSDLRQGWEGGAWFNFISDKVKGFPEELAKEKAEMTDSLQKELPQFLQDAWQRIQTLFR